MQDLPAVSVEVFFLVNFAGTDPGSESPGKDSRLSYGNPQHPLEENRKTSKSIPSCSFLKVQFSLVSFEDQRSWVGLSQIQIQPT